MAAVPDLRKASRSTPAEPSTALAELSMPIIRESMRRVEALEDSSCGSEPAVATRTLGAHERDQIQEQIDKKHKELFRAQKKYIQAQQEQFMDKDKKVTDLRSKLQMSFGHERIASVKLTIVS